MYSSELVYLLQSLSSLSMNEFTARQNTVELKIDTKKRKLTTANEFLLNLNLNTYEN